LRLAEHICGRAIGSNRLEALRAARRKHRQNPTATPWKGSRMSQTQAARRKHRQNLTAGTVEPSALTGFPGGVVRGSADCHDFAAPLYAEACVGIGMAGWPRIRCGCFFASGAVRAADR
jgi:hypothetical protein